MSYFAVHVKTGWEQFTVDRLQKHIENTLFDGIQSIIAPVLEIKKFIGQDVVVSKQKMLTSSYIFIKTRELTVQVPGAIYHFLKNIAGVLNILPYDIPESQIEEFCDNYDLAIEEAEIEVQINKAAATDETIEKEKANVLHKCNISEVNEKKKTIEKFDSIKRTIDVFNEIIEEGKNLNHRLLTKCRAYIHSKRETFRFPLALFLKTRDRIDPEKTLSNKQLTTYSFILPALMQTMKEEIRAYKLKQKISKGGVQK